MPARHGSRVSRQGTRNAAGAAPGAQYPRPAQQTSACWPGWYDDGNGRCLCSWSICDGVRQVKFANSACPVRHKAAP